MDVTKFVPKKGLLIVKSPVKDLKTESGFEVEENTDDFLVYAEVVASDDSNYSVGSFVVLHTLYTQEFRDGADVYMVVEIEDVLGTYTS